MASNLKPFGAFCFYVFEKGLCTCGYLRVSLLSIGFHPNLGLIVFPNTPLNLVPTGFETLSSNILNGRCVNFDFDLSRS